jgi:hypothetical protein
MVGDKDTRILPKGFYLSAIQHAIEALSIDTYFSEKREAFDFPNDTLTLPMPKGCFNLRNIYLFNGNECNIQNSQKVYWKRNYFTKGEGFIANDKGNNFNDPFYDDLDIPTNRYPKGERFRQQSSSSNVLYYNVQMGDIMFSSSCRGVANKVMLHFNNVFTNIEDAPIIPVMFRRAIEDYTCEFALRAMLPTNPEKATLWKIYDARLNAPYDGSWAKAENIAKSLHSSQLEELKIYLGRGAWSSVF